MINYSEDKDRQYHVQLEEGDVGRYVSRPEIQSAVRRLRNILKMLCL